MVDNGKRNNLVSFAEEIHISRPAYQERIPVTWLEWDFIKRRIHRCRVGRDWWGLATSFFFSIMIFGLGVALTAEQTSLADTPRMIYFSIAGAGGLLAVVCLIARISIRHTQHRDINDVLDEMAQIEKRYRRPANEIADNTD